MKVLLDTCVLIDSLQNREPFSKFSNQILIAAAGCRFAGCISAKSVADIYYLMHRYTHDDRKIREQVDCIVTRNTRDYAGAALPVLEPDAFLKKLNLPM